MTAATFRAQSTRWSRSLRGVASVGRVFYPLRGARTSQGVGVGHRALDLAAPLGTPVFATRSGIVSLGGGDRGYGTLVRVQHPEANIEELFAHLGSVAKGVRSGTRVQAGQLIGYVGLTGNTSGPHLHYEVNPIGREVFHGSRSDISALDPIAYLKGALQPSGRSVRQVAPSVLNVPPWENPSPSPQSPAPVVLPQVTQPVVTTPANSGAVSLTTTPAASAPDVPILGALGGPMKSEVAAAGQRVGFIAIGYTLVVVGIIGLLISYREQGQAIMGRVMEVKGKAASLIATKGVV